MTGKEIKRRREDLRLTRQELATKIGIDATALWRIEEEGQEPRKLTREAIEKALSQTPSDVQFAWAGNSARAWHIVSKELLAASRVLKERADSFDSTSLKSGDPTPYETQLGAVELMLRGMAMECLLKALWLKSGNVLVQGGKYEGVPKAADHDLVQLASATKFVVKVQEKDVLRRLSHFIQYGGRYPIPQNASALKLTQIPGGGRAAPTTWTSPRDGRLFDQMVQRINAILE